MLKLTEIFKLLGDDTRFRMAVLLSKEELCVCELCGILELEQPKVSKHLAKMKDRGLVTFRREEQFIYYSLNIENKIIKDMIETLGNDDESYCEHSKDMYRLANKDKYSGKDKMQK
jgi:ArsR family transcriptional regulator